LGCAVLALLAEVFLAALLALTGGLVALALRLPALRRALRLALCLALALLRALLRPLLRLSAAALRLRALLRRAAAAAHAAAGLTAAGHVLGRRYGNSCHERGRAE
jgi:hypothetical protein